MKRKGWSRMDGTFKGSGTMNFFLEVRDNTVTDYVIVKERV